MHPMITLSDSGGDSETYPQGPLTPVLSPTVCVGGKEQRAIELILVLLLQYMHRCALQLSSAKIVLRVAREGSGVTSTKSAYLLRLRLPNPFDFYCGDMLFVAYIDLLGIWMASYKGHSEPSCAPSRVQN